MRTAVDAIIFAMKMAVARRFHTHNVLRDETLGHHSHGVVLLVHLLYPNARKELLVAAALHDLGEGEFGDIPGHTKRRLDIRKEVGDLESAELQKHGIWIPSLTPVEEASLKFCDSAHGALYCLEEIRRGNVDLRGALRNFIDWIHKFDLDGTEIELRDYIRVEGAKHGC